MGGLERGKLMSEKECPKYIKEMAVAFCYWWYNQPGNNTQQGFDKWFDKYGHTFIEAHRLEGGD